MESTPPPPPPPFTPAPQAQPRLGWWSRNWKWFVPTGCCLTPLVLLAAFVAFLVFSVGGVLKHSDAYKNAVARAKADSRVTSALGTPISEGWFVSGSVHTSLGSGDANLTIPISGPKGKGTITAVASKSGGEWTYSKLEVKIDGSGETIDLMETKGFL